MSASIDVTNFTDFAVKEEEVVALAQAVMRIEKAEGSATLAFVDAEEMTRLNSDYRGSEEPTDVLSFPYHAEGEEEWPEPEDAEDADYLGDVAIAPEVAAENAAADGITLSQEIATLVIHGLLHLLGYDHEQDEGEMLERQSALLARLWLDAPRELI